MSRNELLDAMSEAELQDAVLTGLKQRGYVCWHVQDSRLMAAGLPDIIAIRPGRELLLWELKTATGRVRPAQASALHALGQAVGVDVRIVRPSDWDVLRETL
jgi:hypothetical protein